MLTTKKRNAVVSTRWMIGRDMEEVSAIENVSFTQPWTEKQLKDCWRQRECVGIVAECRGEIVGFYLVQRCPGTFRIIDIAVKPGWRLRGVGRKLIDRLKEHLVQREMYGIVCEVSERNLAGQVFLRQVGFRATQTLKNFCDNGEDAYLFEYVITKEEASNI